jgi:hypothetical protein
MSAVRTAVAALAVALTLPAVAMTHGGYVLAQGGNDAYRLSVQAIEVDGGVVDVTAYPIRVSDGRLERDARVEIAVDDGRVVRAEYAEGVHHALVPNERAGEWRAWAVTARVVGPAGTLSIRGEPLVAPDAGAPPWLWLITAALLIALALYAGLRLRRREAEQVTARSARSTTGRA